MGRAGFESGTGNRDLKQKTWLPMPHVSGPTTARMKRTASRPGVKIRLETIVICETTVVIGTETAPIPYSYRHRHGGGAGNFYRHVDGQRCCRGIIDAHGTIVLYTKCVRGTHCKWYDDGMVCAIGSTTNSASIGPDKKIATKLHGTIGGCGNHIRTVVVIRAGPIHRRHITCRFRGDCGGFVLPTGVKICDRVGGDQEGKEHKKSVFVHD